MRRAGLALAWVLAAVGCEGAAPPTGASGQTAASLALGADGRLWVASRDDDMVVGLDPTTLAVQARVPVAGEPGRVLAIEGGLAVIGARSTALTLLGASPRVVRLPCGGATGLVGLGDRLFVACPFDDRVVEVDAIAGQVSRVLAAPGRPTAVAVAGGRLWVTASRLGVLRHVPLSALPSPDPWTLQPVEWHAEALPTRPGHAAVQLDSLHVAGGRLVGAYQIMQHDGDRDRPPEEGGYGRVVDAQPRIEPRALADCGSAYARFDGGVRAQSGPSAVALDAARDRLWVVHRATGQVVVFGCRRGAAPALLPILATFRVGDGARGIVLDGAGVAWVDVAFDHAVARLAVGEPPLARARPVDASALSAHAQLRRRLFHDARNVHLTPSGVVTCATCHPDGGDDGLAWFLHTLDVPRKLRRTPPVWAARPEVRPLHWDGEFVEAEALVSSTLSELLQGDGLLVDPAAIAAWMRSRPPPVPRPLSPREAAAAERGRGVFEASGCAACHSGAAYTDGLAHAVLSPSADPDGRLDAAITPGLVATRARAPYFHDGRAQTLGDVLDAHAPPLAASAQADLLAFLSGL